MTTAEDSPRNDLPEVGAPGGAHSPPEISIVIPATSDRPVIVDCLRALEQEVGDADIEVLVLDRDGVAELERLAERFPRARRVRCSPRRSIPELRARGFELARAPVVAVLEDHCFVQPGWLRGLRRLQTSPHAAIGGVVENGAVERLRDWAAFFCEYSGVMGPVDEGVVDDLPGNNVGYRKEALASVDDLLQCGVWETFLHRAIRERGGTLYATPAMIVVHRREFGCREYLAQRFHLSRSFAAMRAAGYGTPRRALYGLLALCLPPLLLGRIVRRLTARRRFWCQLLGALPLMALYTVAWGIGEAAGAWAGAADSTRKVN